MPNSSIDHYYVAIGSDLTKKNSFVESTDISHSRYRFWNFIYNPIDRPLFSFNLFPGNAQRTLISICADI